MADESELQVFFCNSKQAKMTCRRRRRKQEAPTKNENEQQVALLTYVSVLRNVAGKSDQIDLLLEHSVCLFFC